MLRGSLFARLLVLRTRIWLRHHFAALGQALLILLLQSHKMNNRFLFLLSIVFLLAACQSEPKPTPPESTLLMTNADKPLPKAAQKPKELTIHGDTRIDEYYWLNERENPEVIDYLNAENDYLDARMAHLKGFQEELYDEIVGRIKKTDESVPYFNNGYWYNSRYEDGKEYPIFGRKKGSLEAAEEVMLDVNDLAEGFDYFAVGGRSVSPSNELLVYGEDTLSRRIYTLRFKNLETGEMLPDVISGTTGRAVWANDNKTVFYTVKDPVTLRSVRIMRHTLGMPVSDDVIVFEENDDTFGTFVYKTKSKQFIVIGSYATLTQEYRYINADTPLEQPTLFEPRNRADKLEYSISHYDDKWFIRTNLDAPNFRLMEAPLDKTSRDNWKEVVAHRPDVLLEDMEIFNDYLVLSERIKGITQLRIIPNDGSKEHYIDFPEDAYLTYSSTNLEFDTENLRIGYTSLVTPNSIFDYNMKTREFDLKKQQEVLGDFDIDNYASERLYARAKDGTQVPISLVYKKGTRKNGVAPLLLYGYGSYGSSMEPTFSSVRLSLLDRGFIYAIAHIRGGEEMGRHWYEDGKLLKKKNTFTDFIDCGDFLIEKGYTDTDHLFAYGGSAGGLLVGAVINMRPEMWRGVLSAVPFVDVVTTMLDESIPLTTGEYDEWGNPNDSIYYEYIKSYSPYDNVEAKNYPAMLVTTGLHDSQVQYWEPAKWVARIRERRSNDKPLLLYTDMAAGHGGASGRFARYKKTAMEYAFLLDLAGRVDEPSE